MDGEYEPFLGALESPVRSSRSFFTTSGLVILCVGVNLKNEHQKLFFCSFVLRIKKKKQRNIKHKDQTRTSKHNRRTRRGTRRTTRRRGRKEMVQVKCVLVGEDEDQWKVRLILSFISGEVSLEANPKYQASYQTTTRINNEDVEFEMYETFGVEGYDRLRPLKYAQADVFLLFFSVSCAESFERAKDKWFLELQHISPSTPIILIAITHGGGGGGRDPAPNSGSRIVSKEKGFRFAQKIKAKRYLECSLHDISNIRAIFAEAFRVLQQHEGDVSSSRSSSSSCCIS